MAYDLSQMRAEAGARYTAAVEELRAAYVDLAGIEAAINNGNVAHANVATFRGDADRVPHEFRHPEYFPESGDSLRDAQIARRDEILRLKER